VEKYKELNGYYPETIIADTIYGTRENRQWLTERNIGFSGKALGRPPKESLTPYQKRKRRREQGIRNQIEGKFGQGKNAYNLNRARTRAARTSESWVVCIMFVMNLIKFSQVFLFFFQKWIKKLLSIMFVPDFGHPGLVFAKRLLSIYSPNLNFGSEIG
jgi:transposase, IS5 family